MKATKLHQRHHSVHSKANSPNEDNKHQAPEATSAIVDFSDNQGFKTVTLLQGSAGGGIPVQSTIVGRPNPSPGFDETCLSTIADSKSTDLLDDSKIIAVEDAADDVITRTIAPEHSPTASDANKPKDAFDVEANDLSEVITDDQLHRTQTETTQDQSKEVDNIKTTTNEISSVTEDQLQLNEVVATATQPTTDPEGPLLHQDDLEAEPVAISVTVCTETDLPSDESRIECSFEQTEQQDNQPISTESNKVFEGKSSDKTTTEEPTIRPIEVTSCQDNVGPTTDHSMPTDGDDKTSSFPQPLPSDTPCAHSIQDSSSSESLPLSLGDSSPLSTTHPKGNLRTTITGISIAYTRLKLKILKMQLKSAKNRNYRDDLSTGESLAHLSLVPEATDSNSSEDTDNKASEAEGGTEAGGGTKAEGGTETEGGTDELGVHPPPAKTSVDLTRGTLPEGHQKYSIDYEEGDV